MAVNTEAKAPVKSPAKKPAKKKSKGKSSKKGLFGKIIHWIKISAIVFFTTSILSVILYRFVNPPFTPLMVIRAIEMKFDGEEMKMDKKWVPIINISPNMLRAIITSEDQNFKNHYGFDFNAIQKAAEHNSKENVRVIKGASTISQQTAKNVFLWPHRDWIRKGLEVYFTTLIELFWSKERIMEVYLNVIEFGKGVYGIEAASQFYYHKSAKELSMKQAASTAAIVPCPLKWSPIKPTPRVARHSAWILRNVGNTPPVKFN